MKFSKRKFINLDPRQRHKRCAELLRSFYEKQDLLDEESSAYYTDLLQWMRLSPPPLLDLKSLADQYHWHLEQAGLSLKEHNLLPSIRTGDREARCDFPNVAIYLDNIRSAYNVGSILRTAEALRIGSVHFSGNTPFIDNEKVQRTAMGAAEIVPCFKGTPLSTLPRPIIALDTSDEAIELHAFSFPKSFTLILGNEEYGISNGALIEADTLVDIPLFGVKNSLNVACAFAIASAEIRNQFSPLSKSSASERF